MVSEEDDRSQRHPPLGRKIISMRTGIIAYAILLAIAVATLKGYALAVAVIVVLGAAVKSYVHYLRERME